MSLASPTRLHPAGGPRPRSAPGPEPRPVNYLNNHYGILVVAVRPSTTSGSASCTWCRSACSSCSAASRRAGPAQPARPTGAILERRTQYNKAFTAHGTMMMLFLFLIPVIPAVLGNFFVPMMIGAKDMAFPKLNLASWYVFMIGAAVLPVATARRRHGHRVDAVPAVQFQVQPHERLYAGLGVFITGFSSIMTGLNIIATVHKMRAPGMTWGRLPLFVWAHVRHQPDPVARPRRCWPSRWCCWPSSGSSASASSTPTSAATRSCSSTCSGSTATRPCTS